ncbi:DUF1295 domain-containing protein [Janibacter melonis]|uniref:DUF1295 domain-containing protein n=1 Tax=Janibacter melonis TaxID=262209 RepID=A0A5P8FRC4_9MICO|nr:DUF1295 domain-containing protein [Janibacter melonis]MCB5991915.1 DUF1295 domain-containing protein [Janibacter melonis]QFQ31534.1 DUF1295 domain-containing protein [Janibacter melonis]
MTSALPWGDVALNLGVSVLATAVFIGVIMATAVAIKNHSIIDIFWGPGFVVVAVVSYLLSAGSGGDDTRRLVVLLLTAVWGLRLGLHIGRRNLGHGQDPRYTRLLASREGGSLVVFLVRQVYGLQGLLIVLVSLPVQLAMYESAPLGVVGAVGIAIWVVGFTFEAVGDWQLSRFKADPANEGRIMDRGLWAWTRHPNYFGDSCVWVGLWVLALGHWAGLLTVIAPFVMTKLLVSYSGKKLLEKGMRRKRGAAYEDYIARTSGFFPMPPKRRAARTSA